MGKQNESAIRQRWFDEAWLVCSCGTRCVKDLASDTDIVNGKYMCSECRAKLVKQGGKDAMKKTGITTTKKVGNVTTTTTVKSAATSMPCVGKVAGVEGGRLAVPLDRGVKGVRSGSILMLRKAGAPSDVMAVGRVVQVVDWRNPNNGVQSKVAWTDFIGAWFSSYVPQGVAGSSVKCLGNVFITLEFAMRADGQIRESLKHNKFPFNIDPRTFTAYWMLGDARDFWEQRIEIPRDSGKHKIF